MLCRTHVDVAEGVRRCARCGTPYCPDCLVEIAGRPYCATCKNEQLLDLQSGVQHGQLALASRWNRFGALIVDGLLIAIPMWAIMFLMIFMVPADGEPPLWMQLIGVPFSILSIIYEALMLQYKNGQTLGKMALKVRVVRPDGSPISGGQAWGRVAIRTILGCGIDYIPALFTQEKTAIHDMVAGTRVVRA